MHQRIHGAIIDCDSVVNVCSDLLQAAKPVVRLLDIERVVCEAFGLGGKSLQEASKAQAIAQPRMLAMFLARKFTSSAYSDIGKHFGNRRHSTVISAEKKVNDWLSEGTTLPQRQGKVAVREIIKALEASLKLG
jgi:chromosomal replication initiator protein